jgi:type VI secretion system secreted protein VgrG
MSFSQIDRLIRIKTPLADETFVVLAFTGTESICKPFLFDLRLASQSPDIACEQLIGKNVTVAIRSGDRTERFFNGIIIAFAPAVAGPNEGCHEYAAVMAPALWKLTQCYDCRIFQDLTVPQIIAEVLGTAGSGTKKIKTPIDFRMETGTHPKREFCMQYNESDYDFIGRLCEDEGLFYFFEHQNDKHIIVFGDKPSNHKPHAQGPRQTICFQRTLGALFDKEVVTGLQPQNRLTVAAFTTREYNFRWPTNAMQVARATQQPNPNSEGERYEYPGGYDTEADGAPRALARIQEQDARLCAIFGSGNCRSFCPGYLFTLKDFLIASMNGKEYLLTSVTHEAIQALDSGAGEADSYANEFVCMAHAIAYRPQRRTPKPVMAGNLTAIVTGPSGKEIHTDENGHRMVKVRFAFDRRDESKRNGDMSCWMRVSQGWAGNSSGAIFIPRIGQEVLVAFIDGDPDRPIIVGRVYHGLNKAPHCGTREETKSAIMSASTPKGRGRYNEICFEDLTDAEVFSTHAAKDQNEVVENDLCTTVKRHQQLTVEQNRTVTVNKGDESIQIGGARTLRVQNNESHANSAGFAHKVAADYVLKVNGNITIDASGLVTITGAKIILNG